MCFPRVISAFVIGNKLTSPYKAICAALQELGIRSYHFSEMAKHKENNHFDRWFSSVEAKYDINIPKTWSTCQIPEDFDNVLGSYDVSTAFVPSFGSCTSC